MLKKSSSLRLTPTDACYPRNMVKMSISAEHWQPVLPSDGGNPEVVHRDRSPCGLELEADFGIMTGGDFIRTQDGRRCECSVQPSAHFFAKPGLENAKTKFRQSGDWDTELICLRNVDDEFRFILPPSGEAVGIDDHFH
jgi:hypothetical protein